MYKGERKVEYGLALPAEEYLAQGQEERSCRGAALFAALIAPRCWINVILWLDKCYREGGVTGYSIPLCSKEKFVALPTETEISPPNEILDLMMLERRVVLYFRAGVDYSAKKFP